jgi:mRNA-degrading endonuclease RelE of RelBE toxin-antitoxin system
MADQAGMRAVNQAVAALAKDPEPPEVFVRGSYRRLRVGAYRVLYEVEGDVIIVVRVDKILT